MKRLLVILLIAIISISLVACSVDAVKNAMEDYVATKDGGVYPSGYGGGSRIAEGMPDMGYAIGGKMTGATSDGEVSNGKTTDEPAPRAGLLTACAYADWEYSAYWQGLLTSDQQGAGKFAGYFNTFAFKPLRQVTVTVEGVAGAKVSLIKDEVVLSTARTNNAGKAYVFAPSGSTEGLTVQVETADAEGGTLTFEKTVENGEVAFAQEELTGAIGTQFNRIEVLFVIDTTGSMGDEINYLKEEITDVIGRIKSETGADVLLGIMVYRDEGDEYVTRFSDFSTDIAKQQEFLSKQDAAGGGDFEEAVDQALTQAVNKQWSKNATKLIVHVADAPAHDEDVETWNEAAEKASEAGIRIVTVASSGIDEKTEFFFRSQSLMTGGAYIWLTDDSGIGGAHLEATVEHRPQVEALNDCIVRVVKCLHTGDEDITLPAPVEQEQPEQEPQQQSGEQQTEQGEEMFSD